MEFPKVKTAFLNDICTAFRSRTKAISHKGRLTIESDPNDCFEWITFLFQPLVGPYVILQTVEDNRLSIFIRSHKVSNRGQVLLAINDLLVIGNGALIVEAFEWTLEQAFKLKDGLVEAETTAMISTKWQGLSLQLGPIE